MALSLVRNLKSCSLLSRALIETPLKASSMKYHEKVSCLLDDLERAVETRSKASFFPLKVIDHYENPRNVGSLNKKDEDVGTGLVGAPACGDVMKLQIKVDENGKIIDAKFKTFGCGSAIASSSLATEWIKGKTVSSHPLGHSTLELNHESHNFNLCFRSMMPRR